MSHHGKRTDTSTGAESPGSKNCFVKSSTLAPVSLNWMGMYLIKEHMNAHYRRLYSVKASVDSNRRGQSNKHVSRSAGASRNPSRSSSRAGNANHHSRHDESPRECQPRQTELMDKLDRYFQSVEREKPRIPDQHRIRSVRPSSSTSYVSQKCRSAPAKIQNKRNTTPDLLDRHVDRFTRPAEPFVPRTLIRESRSRVAESRVYQAPSRRCSSQSSIVQTTSVQSDYHDVVRPYARRNVAIATGRKKRLVPALNIQRDTDHMRWLEEQARKVRAEQKLNELDSTSQDHNETESEERHQRRRSSCHCNHTDGSYSCRLKTSSHKHEENSSGLHSKRDRQHSFSSHSSLWVKKQLEAE